MAHELCQYSIVFVSVATCDHWDAYRMIPSFSCCFMAHVLCTAAFTLLVWQHVGTEMHTGLFLPSPAAYWHGTRALYSILFARVATCGHWDAYRKIPSFSCCLVAHDLCTAFLSFPLWQQVGTEMHTERFTPSPAAYRHGTRSSYNQLLLYSCVCVWTQRFGEDSSILFLFLIVRSLIWVLCSRAISFSVICNSVFLLTKNVNRDPQQTPSTDCVCSCCLQSIFGEAEITRDASPITFFNLNLT